MENPGDNPGNSFKSITVSTSLFTYKVVHIFVSLAINFCKNSHVVYLLFETNHLTIGIINDLFIQFPPYLSLMLSIVALFNRSL
jgi:hypothetical protein